MDSIVLIVGGGLAGVMVLFVALALASARKGAGRISQRLVDGLQKVVPRTAVEPRTVTLSRAKEKEFQKIMAERIFRPLSSVVRLGQGSQSKLVERLVHAGIRRKGAAEVFLGAKVVIALSFPAATAAFMLWRASVTRGEVNIRNLFLYCAAAMILGLIMPNIWLGCKAKQRMETIRFALPDALDLLVVCIESGLALDASFVRLAHEIQNTGPELGEELTLMNLEVSAGKPREDCLRNFGLRTGVEETKSLAARIIQTTRFGTNLAHSLRTHAESLREKRRQAAEERAAKTTVKLLFPLVFFIFPAIFVVILGPAIVNISRVFGA